MFTTFLAALRKFWFVVPIFLGVGVVGYGGYSCGAKSRDAEVSALAVQVASNEKTTEIQKGLYATAIVQLDGLNKLLDTSQAQNAALKKQLADSGAQLLTTQQLVVQWKKAYEGAVSATQTSVPSTTDPTVTRKRVDFTKDFGPILISGFTLTDPPEGQVSVKQTRALKLTVAVARNPNGTWSSYVTSSDPDVTVDVGLAGVDPGVLDLGWKQKIWLDLGADFVGGHRVSAGASYHFDRFSVGASCSVWDGDHGCGVNLGFRPFK